nr:hypothetical protein [Tanacetum cinerariifolium]
MLNRDSSIISSSSKINSLLDEFPGELTLLKSILPGIDKTDCHPENEIHLSQRLLYDNSSIHLLKLPVCYDDDDDEEESNSLQDNIISGLPSCSAVTPSEPVDSLSMGMSISTLFR